MTTAPYAKLRANIASAGNLTGALVGAAGATCQLSQDPAGLGGSWLYEITDYPEGWACPTGWTASSLSGVYSYSGLTPPSFTLPALPLWGKLALRLTVNNGDPGTSGLDKTQFVDSSTVISTPDPSGAGYEDVAYGESSQWDSKRKWLGAIKRNIRRGTRLGPYTSATLRQTAVLTAADQGREAFQTDTTPPTVWKLLLVSGGVNTWSRIDSGPESVSSAIGAILGSEPQWWLDGASSGKLVDAGSGVCSSWIDSTANARNFTFGVGARPTIQATGLNSKSTLRFSSSQYGGNAAYTMPAPGTTLSYFWAIAKPISPAANTVLASFGSNQGSIYLDSGSTLVGFAGNTGNHSTAVSLGTWYRIEVLFSHSAGDYATINGVAGTAGDGGNSAIGAGMYLNGTSAGGSIGNWEYAEMFQWTGAVAPTSGMKTALASYSSAKWGV